MNHGHRSYKTSLLCHHKLLCLQNVYVWELYLNVIFTLQLKGVFIRRAESVTEGRGGIAGDKKCISHNDFPSSVFFFFALCLEICHEGCPSHVTYLRSINYGYRSCSHSENCHLAFVPLCWCWWWSFVMVINDLIYRTACECVYLTSDEISHVHW